MYFTAFRKVNTVLTALMMMALTTITAQTGNDATTPENGYGKKNRIALSALANSYDARLGMPLSIHPDFACIKLTQDSGSWKNMVGQTFGFAAAETGHMNISVAISGFIELHDITGQFMSWQMWRGNLGAGLYLEHKKLNRQLPLKSKLILQTGWNHESQHVTDMKTFIAEYTNLPHPDSFNNGTARSFEYITVQLHYLLQTNNEQWNLIIRPGFRYYPQPLLADARRNQKYAFGIEAGIHRKIRKLWDVYIHGLYESINNDYVSNGFPYKYHWNKQPLLYRQIEAGLGFNYNKKQCNLFMRYSNSNGRGLDYLRTFECVGGGFRFIL